MEIETFSGDELYRKYESESIGKVLEIVKGMDVDDALKLLDTCKDLILTYSSVSYPWDRIKKEDIQDEN